MFDSKHILSLLARPGSHIVRESAGGRFATDTWVIKSAGGKDLEADLGGFAYSPVEVSESMFGDLGRAHLVAESLDHAGNTIYRASAAYRIAA